MSRPIAFGGLLLLLAPMVQANDRDLCGAYCVYLGLRAVEVPVESYERLQEELGPPPAGGYSLGQLDRIARSHGAQTLAVKTTLDNLLLRNQRFACIAHLKEDHFVLLSKIEPEGVVIIDPPRKNHVPRLTWNHQWDGVALLLSPSPLTPEEELRAPMNWWTVGSLLAAVILGGAGLFWRFRRSGTA